MATWTDWHHRFLIASLAALTAVAVGTRGVMGFLNMSHTGEAVRASADVAGSSVDVVMTLHAVLDWGWLVLAVICLVGAMLVIRRGTGAFLLLWSSAVIGFPLVFFGVNLPSAPAVRAPTGIASAAAAIMLFVVVLAWPVYQRSPALSS